MRGVLFLLGVVVGLAVGAGGVWLLNGRRAPSKAAAAPVASADQGWARVAAAPDDAAAWASLADRQATDGEVARAARSFATAVAIAPADADLRARYGFLLYELGRDGPALAQLRKARDMGSKAAMLDFTVTTLGSELDETGPFPRFVDKGGEPRVAGATPSPSPAETPPPVEQEARSPADAERADDERDEDDADDGDDDEGDDDPIDVIEPFDDELDDEEMEPDVEPIELEAPTPEPDVEVARRPRPSAPPVAGGQCAIPLRPRGRYGTFVADIVVGRREASLVFDTGATLTVITREYAVAANVRIDDFNAITVRTANGTTRFSTAVIDELAIGDLVATNIRAAVCDDCGIPGMAGLLGLDVQRQLRLSLDVTEGVARYPCD